MNEVPRIKNSIKWKCFFGQIKLWLNISRANSENFWGRIIRNEKLYVKYLVSGKYQNRKAQSKKKKIRKIIKITNVEMVSVSNWVNRSVIDFYPSLFVCVFIVYRSSYELEHIKIVKWSKHAEKLMIYVRLHQNWNNGPQWTSKGKWSVNWCWTTTTTTNKFRKRISIKRLSIVRQKRKEISCQVKKGQHHQRQLPILFIDISCIFIFFFFSFSF